MTINTLRPRQDGRRFVDDIFKFIFREWNIFYFDLNCTEVCSQVSNWQQASIGSDSGLAPVIYVPQ